MNPDPHPTDFRLDGRDFICREAVESLLDQPCRATRLLCVFSTEPSEGAHKVTLFGEYARCQGQRYPLGNLYTPLSELLLRHPYTLWLTLTPL